MTCGGLCPGLNDVVQNIVFTLTDYGVPEDQVLGIRYGLRGFYEREDKPITLTRRAVDGIHLKGGTMLVGSRCRSHHPAHCTQLRLFLGSAPPPAILRCSSVLHLHVAFSPCVSNTALLGHIRVEKAVSFQAPPWGNCWVGTPAASSCSGQAKQV